MTPKAQMRRRLQSLLTGAIYVVFAAAIVALAIWWQMFRWQECRHVGHSTLYCILAGGR